MEKFMLEEAIILKEIELLQQRLSLIRVKLEFERKFNNPDEQKVIGEPSLETSESQTIPEQTAPGKEISNPFIPVNLVKIQTEVQTSTTLIEPLDINLRPNGGIQIPSKTEGQTSAASHEELGIQRPKSYYVVFNGPNPGIYTTWEVAEQAVKHVPGIKHKKYKSLLEAQTAGKIYTTSQMTPPLEFIRTADCIKPTYQSVLAKAKNKKTILGSIPVQKLEENLAEDENLVYEPEYTTFDYIYKLGRRATEQTFVEEKFFTTDKKNVSYFSCYPNSHPELVFEAYKFGLLSVIYPSKNLLEISKFSEHFRKAIKTYRTRYAKEKDIFLKFHSSIISWNQKDEAIHPITLIQLGIVKEKDYSPSQVSPCSVQKEDLHELAVQKLITIAEKLFAINGEAKIKVNYCSSNCLMTSYSHQKISAEDLNKINIFRRPFLYGKIDDIHSDRLCNRLMKIVPKSGYMFCCLICSFKIKDNDKESCNDADTVEEPTTLKEDSLPGKDKEIWDTLGEPSGKYDYYVKYSTASHSPTPISEIISTGWDD